MPKASVTRLIERDKKTLIDFVLDIEKYPEFIPFCIDSKVYEKKEEKESIKLTQNSSVCVLHTNSFNNARPKKKNIHLRFKISHPISDKGIDFPITFLSTGSFVKYFPKYKAKANMIFIIVGFT